MSHDCIARINEQLAEHNSRISVAFSISEPARDLIKISTTKVDEKKRSKPINLFATFCPFCGESLKGGAE